MSDLPNRIRNMVARAVINLINDAQKMQVAQVDLLADETQDDVERYQNYGFTSVPFSGAEGVVLSVGGTRSHAILIAVDDRRYRLTGLPSGEVAVYDDRGQVVHLKRDGIEIRSPDEVVVIAPVVTVEAAQVNLGGEGGAKVARIGDDVDPVTHKIISGSEKVKAL